MAKASAQRRPDAPELDLPELTPDLYFNRE